MGLQGSGSMPSWRCFPGSYWKKSRSRKRIILQQLSIGKDVDPLIREVSQKLSGDPTPSTFSKVLPYQSWQCEAYRRANGRHTALQIGCVLTGFPFFKAHKPGQAREVQLHKWGAYCRTNWTCTAALSLRPVGGWGF